MYRQLITDAFARVKTKSADSTDRHTDKLYCDIITYKPNQSDTLSLMSTTTAFRNEAEVGSLLNNTGF